MIEVAILAFIPDPFAVQMSHFIVRDKTGSRKLTARELSDFPSWIVTYESSHLIDDLRRLGHSPPQQLIDVGDALRLIVGRPKDDGGERLFNVWTGLRSHFNKESDAREFELVALARSQRPEHELLEALLFSALDALSSFWSEVVKMLDASGELARFIEVECPLHGVFARRQFVGVRVDGANAAELQSRIAAEKYSAYREVAEIIDRSPTGLNFWNIHPYLQKTDASALAVIDPGGRLQDAFELAAPNSRFASAFLNLVKCSRDEVIVRRAMAGEKRLYPVFSVMGTVSGRILVSDPFLQQLRRAYRSLILADHGMKLVYLDYSQFEPGVLAGISNDRRLIEAYNEGDLYSSLAVVLFGDSARRPIAKRAFLAFLYGMTPDRIAELLVSSSGIDANHKYFADGIVAFFNAYPGLSEFRLQQQKLLVDRGYVASLMGNRRVRTSGGTLSAKERRWALNQPVQASASLIFKVAVQNLASEFGADSILLPVHDAVLLQFRDDAGFDENVDRAKLIMIDAFRRWLPAVSPRVTTGPFSE